MQRWVAVKPCRICRIWCHSPFSLVTKRNYLPSSMVMKRKAKDSEPGPYLSTVAAPTSLPWETCKCYMSKAVMSWVTSACVCVSLCEAESYHMAFLFKYLLLTLLMDELRRPNFISVGSILEKWGCLATLCKHQYIRRTTMGFYLVNYILSYMLRSY